MPKGELLPTIWLMFTADGCYPIQPSSMCTAEDHGRLNPHVMWIESANGKVLWTRQEADNG
jgi:hypothetical protein